MNIKKLILDIKKHAQNGQAEIGSVASNESIQYLMNFFEECRKNKDENTDSDFLEYMVDTIDQTVIDLLVIRLMIKYTQEHQTNDLPEYEVFLKEACEFLGVK